MEPTARNRRRRGSDLTRVMLIGLALGCGAGLAGADEDDGDPNRYRFEFSATFEAGVDEARARIQLHHVKRRVRELNFRMPAPKYTGVKADGELRQEDERWIWRPPADGGALSYTVRVRSMRGARADSRVADHWVIMRLEDLFPRARSRAVKSASGSGRVKLNGPLEWSFETRYGDVDGQWKPIDRPDRVYPQPRGWMVGGELGVRRQHIAGLRVVVAAPRASGLRRMDLLAFLGWTLPSVTEILPDFPQRLLIVGAPRSMWRGALSAPGSLYLHVDRPLVSENGTSTLVHELIHVGGIHSAAAGADWIVEGLAEYYALEVLARSDGITQTRRKRVLRELESWVERKRAVLASPSAGADTARAALLFAALDAELQAHGESLDQVARRLAASETEITEAALRAAVTEILEDESEVLRRALQEKR